MSDPPCKLWTLANSNKPIKVQQLNKYTTCGWDVGSEGGWVCIGGGKGDRGTVGYCELKVTLKTPKHNHKKRNPALKKKITT